MAITDGMVGHWCPSLDNAGNGTTTLTDLSGNGNNGTLTNMDPATDWVADTSNGGVRALDFDGVDDYVDLGTNFNISAISDMTLSGWCSLSVAGNYPMIISSSIGARTETELRYYSNTQQPDGIYNRYSNPVASNSVIIGDWNHILMTVINFVARIYVNGSLAGTGGTSTGRQHTSFNIGRRNIGGFYLGGKLDDMRIYNRALTPAEITALASQRGYTETTNAAPQFQRRMQSGGIL